MNILNFKNKIWMYASIMFMGALLIITLSVISFYSYKDKKFASNLPPQNKTYTNGNGQENINYSVNTKDKDKAIQDLYSINNSLQQELSKLKGNTVQQSIEPYNNLFKAQDMYYENNYVGALDIFKTLNENNFIGYAKDKYIFLKNQIYPKAAFYFYNEGMRAYRTRDYKLAADMLSKAVEYGKDQMLQDDASYVLASAYKALGENDNAKKALDFLFSNFPKSPYVSKGKVLYNSL